MSMSGIMDMKKLSKAGEWIKNHTAPIVIINDRAAIEALRA